MCTQMNYYIALSNYSYEESLTIVLFTKCSFILFFVVSTIFDEVVYRHRQFFYKALKYAVCEQSLQWTLWFSNVIDSQLNV